MDTRPIKRSVELASRIEEEIETKGLPPGHYLGSELDLCRTYEVSRAVFREAVGLLEHHQLARMKTGRGGGLIVAEPNAGTLAGGVALLLRRSGVLGSDLTEARRSVEITAVRLATERLTEQGVETIRACLAMEDRAPIGEIRQHGADFHLMLARLSGNPVLALFTEILVNLTLLRIEPPRQPGEVNKGVLDAHHKVSEAVISGDAALAQHFMNRHFDAMAESWKASDKMPRLRASVFDQFSSPASDGLWDH